VSLGGVAVVSQILPNGKFKGLVVLGTNVSRSFRHTNGLLNNPVALLQIVTLWQSRPAGNRMIIMNFAGPWKGHIENSNTLSHHPQNDWYRIFTAFGKSKFAFAGSLQVVCGLINTFIIKRFTVTCKWTRKRKGIPGLRRIYPKTLRVVCGFVGQPTHAHHLKLRALVLAPSCARP
jgi:hypothetical protein